MIVYVSPTAPAPRRPASGSPQAADVLAMAPMTNIGSSTPIDSSGANIGSDLRRKVINDAAASLRALAAAHDRNTTWPARPSASRVEPDRGAGAEDERHRHDRADLPALLQQLDGYKTKDTQRPFTLHLAGAEIDDAKPGLLHAAPERR